MIKSKDGRIWSERTTEEEIEMLREDFAKLSPEERRTTLLALKEINDPAYAGLVKILDVINASEYKRPLVDIETFVKDEYYLGASCKGTYPSLIADLKEIFRGGYQEVILGGSIGWGKSYLASIILCRVLYELSCLTDIHKTIGLSPGSDVTIAGISVNEQLAIRVVYENVALKIAQSPYFKENFPFQTTKKELRFPNNVIVVALSTTDTAALGRNVLAGFMDEGNFYEPVNRGKAAQAKYGDRDKARVLYDQLVRRMKSRFLRNGKMPGKMVLASSKRTKDDFTAKRVHEAANDPHVCVLDYRIWEVAPERFGAERFHVLVGNETMPSRVLSSEEVPFVRQKIAEAEDDGLVILEVPTEFKSDFENDLDKSINDIGGVSTVSISPFIQQRDKIEKCVDPNRKHPFQVDEWDQTKPGTFIWDRLAKRVQMRDGAEVFEGWQPLYYPQYTRHVHIDMSLNTDCTGICIGCIVGYHQVERTNVETGEKYTEPSPVIWVDLMLRIRPPVGGEIDHGLVRGLVYQMQTHGFTIGLVTMDQAHGATNLQKFLKKGISVERLSVDRPIDAYETLKSAVYEGRINMYKYEPILDELRKLQKDNLKNKVDHPRGGKKDVADALAGIVFSLTTNAHHAPIMPTKGISQFADPELEQDRKMVGGEEFFPPFLIG